MRWLAVFLALALVGPLPVAAQTATETPSFSSPILTIDQERMFAESMFGKAALARLKAGEEALVAENLRIESGLEAEERDLTARRATLPAVEFRALADAFDARVETARAAQREKYTALTAAHDADRRRFIQVALPTIGQLMQELGAAVVVDKQSVVVSLKQVDVTDFVIARLDANIGDGTSAPAPTVPEAPAQP